jgi:hypothetical protein
MSSSTVIRETSNLLKDLLKAGLTTPTNLNPTVELANPADEAEEKDLSIWLYQVSVDPHLRNRSNLRTATDGQRIPPLPLELTYLLTPLHIDEEANQTTLGRALQILYDNAILKLSAKNVVEDLHLSICQRSIQELADVWEALQKPYRLSICFEVRSVNLDSEREEAAGRIAERETALATVAPEAS